MAQVVDDLERSMSESLEAYRVGDERFFGFLADDVRVFNLDGAEPIVGADRFREAFGDFSRERQVDVVHQDVQASSDHAVLSQTLAIGDSEVKVYVRQTVVWELQDVGWRMRHIHNALVGRPMVLGDPPDSAEAVRILNERIATVAAAVGVAQ